MDIDLNPTCVSEQLFTQKEMIDSLLSSFFHLVMDIDLNPTCVSEQLFIQKEMIDSLLSSFFVCLM